MKKHFVTGFVIILPLVLTVTILAFLLKLLTNPFEGMAFAILSHFGVVSSQQLLLYVSRILTLFALIGFTLLIGFIARWVLVHELLRFSDWLFHRIPLINKIYKASQETVTTLLSSKTRAFKQVVLVPFPHRPGLSIGLVTSDLSTKESDARYRHLIPVFIPGTPNPTVGFLLLYQPDQIIPIEMSVEEAIKCVVSCAVMIPGGS